MSMARVIAAAQIGLLRSGDAGTSVLDFRFDPGEPFFAGHFPGKPILPGIFQLEMARRTAETALNCHTRIREVVKAKFLRPISSGETISVSVRVSEQSQMIQVHSSISVGQQPAGEAVLVLTRDS